MFPFSNYLLLWVVQISPQPWLPIKILMRRQMGAKWRHIFLINTEFWFIFRKLHLQLFSLLHCPAILHSYFLLNAVFLKTLSDALFAVILLAIRIINQGLGIFHSWIHTTQKVAQEDLMSSSTCFFTLRAQGSFSWKCFPCMQNLRAHPFTAFAYPSAVWDRQTIVTKHLAICYHERFS